MAVSDKSTEKISLYLPPDQIDQLHKLKGQKRGSTLSGLVEDALGDYLTKHSRPQANLGSDALLSA